MVGRFYAIDDDDEYNNFYTETPREITHGTLHGAGFWSKIKSWAKKLVKPVATFVKDKVIPKLKGKAKEYSDKGLTKVADVVKRKFPSYTIPVALGKNFAKNKIDGLIDKAVNRGNTFVDDVANKYGGRLRGRRTTARKSTKKRTTTRRKPLDNWLLSL